MSIQTPNTNNADNSSIIPYEFEIGEKVLLSTENLPLKRGRVKNFSSKYIGLLKIVAELADGNTYRLELPQDINRIHPTFHISLLKLFG